MTLDTSTTYAQLNIGRNIGDVAMNLDMWHSMIQDAAGALLEASGVTNRSLVEVHTGTGRWTEDDGTVVVEESAHVSLVSRHGFDIDVLRDERDHMLAMYMQDYIAIVTA